MPDFKTNHHGSLSKAGHNAGFRAHFRITRTGASRLWRTSVITLCLLFGAALAQPSQNTLDLRGQIQPVPGRPYVTLRGVTEPFMNRTVAGSNGQFHFTDLIPGTYLINVLIPNQGETSLTVEVTRSFADRKGWVEVTVPFQETRVSSSDGQAAWSSHLVSVQELKTPEKAYHELDQAVEALSHHDPHEAEAHLQHAIRITPGFFEAWNFLGTVKSQDGDFEAAEHCFRKAVDLSPQSFEPLSNLGGALLNLHRYEEALEYNEAAVRLRPKDPVANSQLGYNYYYLHRDNEAMRYFGITKALDPSHFSYPQLGLANIYLTHSYRQGAIRELKEFLALHPDSPKAKEVSWWLEKLRNSTVEETLAAARPHLK
jgi:predicted Zn-dependent protease